MGGGDCIAIREYWRLTGQTLSVFGNFFNAKSINLEQLLSNLGKLETFR